MSLRTSIVVRLIKNTNWSTIDFLNGRKMSMRDIIKWNLTTRNVTPHKINFLPDWAEASDCSLEVGDWIDPDNEALAEDDLVASVLLDQDCQDCVRGCGCARCQSSFAAHVEVMAVAINNRSLKIKLLHTKASSNPSPHVVWLFW